eukprot:3254983-Pyramimonas_sp.AAC.1
MRWSADENHSGWLERIVQQRPPLTVQQARGEGPHRQYHEPFWLLGRCPSRAAGRGGGGGPRSFGRASPPRPRRWRMLVKGARPRWPSAC